MESYVDILQGYTPDRGKSQSRCRRSKVFSGWNIKLKESRVPTSITEIIWSAHISPKRQDKLAMGWWSRREQEVENKRPQR